MSGVTSQGHATVLAELDSLEAVEAVELARRVGNIEAAGCMNLPQGTVPQAGNYENETFVRASASWSLSMYSSSGISIAPSEAVKSLMYCVSSSAKCVSIK